MPASSADVTFPPATVARPAASPSVPAPPSAAVSPDFEAVLHGVGRLLGACPGANKNDRLAVAIEALIEAGVDTRSRIVGAARSLGFDPAHAGVLLGRERHRWRRGADGAFRLPAST